MLHCQHDFFPDSSCNFRGFMHNLSQGPSSNSHSSVQHHHCDSSPSCSYNICSFVHDFSLGLSCSCHSFMLHCQHGSSLDLLDNPPSFCQPSSDHLPHSTTPRILHAFTRRLKFTCSHLLKSHEISRGKYVMQ